VGKLSTLQIKQFQKRIYDYYNQNGRKLPWRKTINPYHILVSEIMLQQTQANRVTEKHRQFIKKFPTFISLANASLSDIYRVWQGMGYNRRALYLKKIAGIIESQYMGKMPETAKQLDKLPGIGYNTASAIVAFAYNQPAVFIETNIRAVFIHEFFAEKEAIDDKDIVPLIKQALDVKNPRIWYWALMDYGSYLKKSYSHLLRKSKHYTKQSEFKGSDRQIRGNILKLLALHKSLTGLDIGSMLSVDADRITQQLRVLRKEGFIKKKGSVFQLS